MSLTKRSGGATRMRTVRNAIVSVIFAAAAVTLVPAGSAGAGTIGDEEGQFCSFLVGPAPEGGVSPVLAKACSDTSPEDAQAAMNAKRPAGMAAPVVIMYWYEHINYNRDTKGQMATITGSAGPCDTSGYRVKPDSYWRSNMSSIIGNSDCNVAKIHNKDLTSSQDFNITIESEGRWLGSYSDNVGLTQPRKSS